MEPKLQKEFLAAEVETSFAGSIPIIPYRGRSVGFLAECERFNPPALPSRAPCAAV